MVTGFARTASYDVMRYDVIWYDVIWYDVIWYDVIWYDVIWYDVIWYDVIWYDVMGPAYEQVLQFFCTLNILCVIVYNDIHNIYPPPNIFAHDTHTSHLSLFCCSHWLP